MATKLTTQKQKLHLANQLIESVSEISNTAYYIFASDHVPRATSEIPQIDSDLATTLFDPYRKMLFGKRVSGNDVKLVIRNIPWESGVVYSMYDDQDQYLKDSDFYVMVDATEYVHIFKCLDNNRDAISTVEPSFAHIAGANTNIYETSDGYRWKYMYSVDSTTRNQFMTSTWFPLVPNTAVANSTVSGAIDIIKVEGRGTGYHNYLTGTLRTADIRVNGDTRVYQVSNSMINHTNGYYTGCLMYLATGTGSGQWARINDYISNANGNFVTLEQQFSSTPTNGTMFEINPEVKIFGTGRNIVNAVARALVNAYSSNSIYRVEMIQRGSGYTFATANVTANSVVGITIPADVRVIQSPFHGHGYDAASELYASEVMFSIKFSNSESNTIPYDNSFQQIGLMKDPVFGEAELNVLSVNGIFIDSEPMVIVKSNPSELSSNIDSYTYISFDAGYIILSEDANNEAQTVFSIAEAGANCIFSYQSNATAVGVTDIYGTIQTGDFVFGVSSGAKAVVNSVSRGGVTKLFTTFVEMDRLEGSLSGGAFVADEIVYQGDSLVNATAYGYLHSSNVSGGVISLYVSDKNGEFGNGRLTGATSLAQADINTVYKPEIIENSGEILFLENIAPVARQNNQTETIQIVFSF